MNVLFCLFVFEGPEINRGIKKKKNFKSAQQQWNISGITRGKFLIAKCVEIKGMNKCFYATFKQH